MYWYLDKNINFSNSLSSRYVSIILESFCCLEFEGLSQLKKSMLIIVEITSNFSIFFPTGLYSPYLRTLAFLNGLLDPKFLN
jgi:hypothetical protein